MANRLVVFVLHVNEVVASGVLCHIRHNVLHGCQTVGATFPRQLREPTGDALHVGCADPRGRGAARGLLVRLHRRGRGGLGQHQCCRHTATFDALILAATRGVVVAQVGRRRFARELQHILTQQTLALEHQLRKSSHKRQPSMRIRNEGERKHPQTSNHTEIHAYKHAYNAYTHTASLHLIARARAPWSMRESERWSRSRQRRLAQSCARSARAPGARVAPADD